MKQVELEVETALVAPSEETPRQPLWLSNLDLAVPRTHTPLVYYYPAPAAAMAVGSGSFFAPDRLKAALAGALVPFYPLAGRLGAGPDGRLRIDCNGKGALFVVARAADLTGGEVFQNYEPSPEVRRTFVPLARPGDASSPIAMFQVTFLKCGGVVLGTAIHHAAMDGVGAFQFIRTWAALARGGPGAAAACVPPPLHDRTLLHARRPPRPTSDHSAYSKAFLGGRAPRPFVTRVYSVSLELLAELKSRCGGASTYCAVTAHLWRCVCAARGVAPGSDTRLGLPANVRHRLSPPLPPGFFGNAVVRNLVTAPVSDVLDGPLGSVAETIREAVARVDDEFARSVMDYLELELGKDAAGGGVSAAAREELAPASDLWAVSWLGMAMYDADFGAGAPRFVAPAQMFGVGTAYMTPCADGDDGIAVLLAMEAEYMPCFEKVFYGEQ